MWRAWKTAIIKRMRRLSTLVFLPLLLAFGAAYAQECVLPASPPPDKSRVVFILDTSGSMQGLGDGQANIFAKVQGAMLRGMRATQAPGSVELLTFDRGPRQRNTFAWPADQQAFEKTVNRLKADGSNTWLYASMQAMFKSLKSRSDTATTVYVITDGIDNNPSRAATIQTALDAFNESRGPFDRLYYVALGVKVPAQVKESFGKTSFAQAIELLLNQPPDFTSAQLSPVIVNVGPDGTFPLKRPAGSKLVLESNNLGGGMVSIDNPDGAGTQVRLKIDGSVPGGTVGYMCLFMPGGPDGLGGTLEIQNNLLLRFKRDTPPLPGEVVAPVDVLGTLVLLNPEVNRTLKRGQSATLRYKAVKGPVTVELERIPTELEARLPDQVVSLLEGEEVTLVVKDKALGHGQKAAPVLQLNNEQPLKVPDFTGVVTKPFPWWTLIIPVILIIPLILWLRRDKRPFDPYALSINRALLVTLHSQNGRLKTHPLRKDHLDIGQAFKENKLRGLILERYRPEIAEEDQVVLDNSDLKSMRQYATQQMQRAARLEAQPERLRLHKDTQPPGTFLDIQETLALGQLYVFTDFTPPPPRVRPAAPPPEPPIEVIVTLLDGTDMKDLELPLEDVDLADVYGNPNLRGLIVRREPGLLRLRGLEAGMQLRHISRQFRPGDALPLAVMLDLSTQTGPYQLRIRDKASLARMQR